MKTIASMREYINEYVRGQAIEKTGYELLRDHFGIPFQYFEAGNEIGYEINRMPMNEDSVKDFIKDFFENLDTTAVLELYYKIKV